MESLGERLKQLRQKANLSLESLSEKTKIQTKYLKYLENEEFDKLPNPVYVKGFVQKWANACGANGEDLLLQLRRENKISFSNIEGQKSKKTGVFSFIITSRHILGIIVFVLVALSATYLFINNRAQSSIPQIEILQPLELSSVSDQDYVTIAGRVKNIRDIKINGTSVLVGEDNAFEYNYNLEEGLNTIEIEANGYSGEQVKAIRKVLKL